MPSSPNSQIVSDGDLHERLQESRTEIHSLRNVLAAVKTMLQLADRYTQKGQREEADALLKKALAKVG